MKFKKTLKFEKLGILGKQNRQNRHIRKGNLIKKKKLEWDVQSISPKIAQ